MASDPSHGASGFHARHESELDHLAHRARIRTEVLARASLGPLLQLCRLCHWHLHQHAHQEEETGSVTKEGEQNTTSTSMLRLTRVNSTVKVEVLQHTATIELHPWEGHDHQSRTKCVQSCTASE